MAFIGEKHNWIRNEQFCEVCFEPMRFHIDTDFQAIKLGKSIIEPYPLIIRLFQFFCPRTHLAIKIKAQRNVKRKVMIKCFVLSCDTQRPWTHSFVVATSQANLFQSFVVVTIEQVEA